MTIYTSYDVRIPKHEYNKVFADTTEKYRAAVEFFISVREKEAAVLSEPKAQHVQLRKMEILTHRTKNNPEPKYDFGKDFYKFPSYLRRAAIAEALGKVSAYESNLTLWEKTHEGAYDTGDKSYHFCVKTPDIEEALALYKEMGIIVREMGGHGCFIEDPDGYQVEILQK